MTGGPAGGAPRPSPGKDGLTSATEVLKYTLTLGAGALVFGGGLVGEKVALTTWPALLLVASWSLLGISVAAGALAYSAIPIMWSESNYNLHDRYFTLPGKIHQICFLLGMLALGFALAMALVAKAGDPPGPGKPGPDKKDPVAPAKSIGPPVLLGRVGPFEPGSSLKLETVSAGEPWLRTDDVLKELRSRMNTQELGYLILVGSADKIELRAALQQHFGSNFGLARSRADTLRQAIETGLGQKAPVVTLTVGPELHGTGVKSAATRGDRSVAIYAAWWQASK